MSWVNVFPNELQEGDVWEEGCVVDFVFKRFTSDEYLIGFKPEPHGNRLFGKYERWPGRAPRRIYRP